MRVWVTKYWNTRGIYEVVVDAGVPSSRGYVYTKSKGLGDMRQQFRLGRDAFKTKNDAVVHCNIEVEKKIRKLGNELQRYKRMKFKHDQLKGFPPRKGIYE